TFGGGLAKFDDVNWTIYDPNNSGLPYWYILSVYAEQSDKIWIGVENRGLTLFKNTSWTTFNTTNSPLPSNNVRDLICDKYGNLWISSIGVAIYNAVGIVSINNNNQNIVSNYFLYQNFPNPFNSSTVVKYDVKFRSNIKITLYDITGKIIS